MSVYVYTCVHVSYLGNVVEAEEGVLLVVCVLLDEPQHTRLTYTPAYMCILL
jgi:hypothetical protein